MINPDHQKKKGRIVLPERKSSIALIILATGILLIIMMFSHASVSRQADVCLIDHMASLVGALELTDLCLFTEARYTRHLSQTDLYSAFQDHPTALEHFPTGSIAGPPVKLRRRNEKLD